MITEFINDHKKICIIILILIIIALIIININSSKNNTEETVSEDNYEEMIYSDDTETKNEILDETQSTKYPDINYGV